MTYEAWRISYQSSEQAARAAYAECDDLRAKIEATEEDRSRFLLEMGRLCAQCDALRAKIARMEQQEPVACKNCNGMGDRFDPSGEKIPCDLCESRSLAAKKIYALPGAKGEGK